MPLLYLFLGALAAAGFLALVHSRDNATNLLGTGLLVAAIVYIVAAFFLAEEGWLKIEATGLMACYLCVLASRKFGLLAIGIGWLLHPLWDYLIHLDGPGAAWMPAWYVLFCISFDAVVGGYCFWRHYVFSARRRLRRP